MDKEYDHKFEEMKKYIPFLENMIKRLESTCTTSNPRQAQLNKIRSLRDLLMDKKKRMKMENLLKCEQVLINLYAKVEQRDFLPETKKDSMDTKQNETDLNIVRKKLQTAVSKLHCENDETLPEIARASATEEVCLPGSKEPALFQRRPNIPSTSNSTHQTPKRNYTRVLLSPETSEKRWSIEDAPQDKPLFCRRSPKKSPKRLSPTYNKKERRKSKNKSKDIRSKDLNITLNVPEESLNSLNTKDILSRIINCSDSDVDIATLRELRTQILGELKETGAKDDISDILLKSYKKKDSKVKNEEIEEGELSDSESEAIDSIYGSLVIVDKDKLSSSSPQKLTDIDKPRKIQICLVINSDKNKSRLQECGTILPVDKSDFEVFSKHENKSTTDRLPDDTAKDIKPSSPVTNISQNSRADKEKFDVTKKEIVNESNEVTENDIQKDESISDKLPVIKETDLKENIPKPKFYTPINEPEENILQDDHPLGDTSNCETLSAIKENQNETCCNLSKTNLDVNSESATLLPSHKINSEIPLIDTTEKVSEIDILQALKNEILSETNSVLPAESTTPLLHLPKVTKVVNAHEIGSKKRISIENYKAKTSGSAKLELNDEKVFTAGKDDVSKKQSLKLTEKECERFNFLTKLKLDTSDDEDKSNVSLEDIFNNLAPKSPDHEDFADTGIKPPVIIPNDPIEKVNTNSAADTDMRRIMPLIQGHNSIKNSAMSPSHGKDNMPKNIVSDKDVNKSDKILIDPRVNRESTSIVTPESPNRYLLNSNNKTSTVVNFGNSTVNLNNFLNSNSNATSNSNIASAIGNVISGNLITGITTNMCNVPANMTPSRTINIGCNMTPNARTFEMTPMHQSFDNDDSLATKHVYAPLFPMPDPRDAIENQLPQWDNSDNRQLSWEERDMRGNSVQRDIGYRNPRNSSVQRDINIFEQYPRNDRFMYDNRDLGNRLDCPPTPNTEFNRMDCANSVNPLPTFGRMDCPSTPNPSFGRIDCPSTPSSSFGRMDAPMTPLPSFGRSECPSTPSHPFGRPEPFSTPYMRTDLNQSFGKSNDPRLNRNSDYENCHNYDDARDRGYFQERKFHSGSYKTDKQRNNTDHYRRYTKEQNKGRNERNKSYEQSGRDYRESHRESSVSENYDRDYESDRYNSRHRGRHHEYRYQNQYKKYDDSERRDFHRENSVGGSSVSRERFSRSFARDHSTGRSYSKENKMSVQHSFTIDTSVSQTFQSKSNNKNECSSFDVRRQRAASVGRTLIVDSSSNKEFNETRKMAYRENYTKKITYKRACSVGREIIKDNKLDFKGIKEDLKSFKFKDNFNFVKGKDQCIKDNFHKVTDSKSTSDYRSRKDIDDAFKKSSFSNTKYFPRNNSRDPRVRRENQFENKEKPNEKYRSNSKEMHRYGIVYSNDNISKGNILGPGYGVKNYKIPKIKKPKEVKDKNETETNTNIENVADKPLEKSIGEINLEKKNANQNVRKYIGKNNSNSFKTEGKSIHNERCDSHEKKSTNALIAKRHKTEVPEDYSNISKHQDKSEVTDISLEKVEKRITRSTSKNVSEKYVKKIDTSPIKRTRRSKLVICDSDSDNEKNKEDNAINTDTSNTEENMGKRHLDLQNCSATSSKSNSESQVIADDILAWSNSNSYKTQDKEIQDTLDSNLKINEIEMFSDNIVSDPVILSNINDLIADLDHDLDSSKNANASSNFTKELSLETMMENITCPEYTENKEIDLTNVVESQKFEANSCDQSNMIVISEFKDHMNVVTQPTNEPSLEVVNKEKLEYEVNKKNDATCGNNEINRDCLENRVSENAPKVSDTIKTPVLEDIRSNEAIVSTSNDEDIQKNETCVEYQIGDAIISTENTPDSTIICGEINENVNTEKNLPDSTNEIKCEMVSDISSTHNSTAPVDSDLLQTGSSQTPAGHVEAIDKLLSILQGIKIKELMGLLGDQSTESEKIKKKLEKLREIVSEDDDTNKGVKTANDSSILNEVKDLQNTCSESEVQSLEKEQCNTSFHNEDNESNIIINEKRSQTNEEKAGIDNNILNEVKNLQNTFKEDFQNFQGDKSNSNIDTQKNNEEGSEINRPDNEEVEANTTIEIVKTVEENNEENEITQSTNKEIENNKDVSEKVVKDFKTAKRGSKANVTKKGKKSSNKVMSIENKRLTRSDVANSQMEKPPKIKISRELQKLQADIKEMFIKDDILSATGLRMCRLAKLVDDKRNQKEEQSQILSIPSTNQKPVVLLKKVQDFNNSEELTDISIRKRSVKCKKTDDGNRSPIATEVITKRKSDILVKPGPKSKTKLILSPDNSDPYMSETGSVTETPNVRGVTNEDTSSDSESESLSSLKSFASLELLAEAKQKVKRKRASKGWKDGNYEHKKKKKKTELKQFKMQNTGNDELAEIKNNPEIPVSNCFIDKTYCFRKNQTNYNCRICSYSGMEIVQHYKKQHPHYEIPLSRMSPAMAKEAIKESVKLNFQVISKVSSKKYVCRFCFEVFGSKKPVLETFFWHIVSMHTGEYKQLCSECLNVTRCPFNLDIPPPPKEANGQLIGYICEKCNYTQISLENLKTHVITRHNDEQTAVYTINLAVMSKTAINNLLANAGQRNTEIKGDEVSAPRTLRSCRSNQSFVESSDVKSDTTEGSSQRKLIDTEKPTKIQSKITFEDDNTDEISNFDSICTFNTEPDSTEHQDDSLCNDDVVKHTSDIKNTSNKNLIEKAISNGNDIFDYPHFKIKYTQTGSKEYICCINGNNHYKTALLISLKKHVQLKHSEVWDGYCYICKVIVTPQGLYYFKDCLQHMLDKHSNFPCIEEANANSEQTLPEVETNTSDKSTKDDTPIIKSYINVRPLSDLITKSPALQLPIENPPPILPIVENEISTGTGTGIQQSRSRALYPATEKMELKKIYKYEEAQAEIMLRKHRVVLEAMMNYNKLVHVFKCAGRYCSFTTDSAEDALLHASTHMRIGGEDSLKCVYCDYDSSNNAIDLITHVFKIHGCSQYVCNLCFYRAAASQLVDSHIKRKHEAPDNKAILHTLIQTSLMNEDDILPRETAVRLYYCQVGRGTDAACKYKTFTPGKFSDHMNFRHKTVKEFPCHVCPVIFSESADLISHGKIHGLMLYQCVWCVYGSDNESELIDHSSSKHPDKLPKAYLRIITNKEGTKEYRVLPLAHLNKSEISSINIEPANCKENPVKEAERSIELQKLMAQTTLVIEPSVTSSNIEPNTESQSNLLKLLIKEEGIEIASQLPAISKTPPHQIEEINTLENQLTPIIKAETQERLSEVSQILPDIVCIDSDEEDTRNVIDLSEDGSNALANSLEKNLTQKTVPHTKLFLCPRCHVTLKYCSAFKKHLNSCLREVSHPITCAHCPLKFTKNDIVSHYTSAHSKANKTYPCCQCTRKFNTLAILKDHERSEHNFMLNTTSNVENFLKKNIIGPRRRKRSQEINKISKDKGSEPPEKIKRFGPHDVHLLPINPILDDSVFCSLCEFSTKVRHNLVRHLQLHAQQQPVPQTAPVNPVPHLETNEKHFDKMVNLASSSITTRVDKNKSDSNVASLIVPPETASRYPKYISEKHRLTCGAKGCSYISVDESMLKCHWETLHSDTSVFQCVHCPPYQNLDNSIPLTAFKVISHLKMHDINLYACSLCSFYHYNRQILESHLNDVHKGGQVLIVREEGITPTSPAQSQIAAPTMDLKAWHCGLCNFKSLSRLNAVEHCAKTHNSKMQYKCAYCAFRTSNSENVLKHQSKSHTDRPEQIFYYYYQEGSIPDDPDGAPLWQKQSQMCGNVESKIKYEIPSDNFESPNVSLAAMPLQQAPQNRVNPEIDLNLVKKEAIEPSEETIEDLCKEFGEFCEPNGLKYKCSLCKLVIEDTIEAMQSHLYEELKYRKWGCSICSYKAFHKAGLSEHMDIEHRQKRDPVPLQVDTRIETWVAKLLEHQTALIQQNKANLAKQKEEIFRPVPGTVTKAQSAVETAASSSGTKKLNLIELEKTFGAFGEAVNMSFCCPKCNALFKEEDAMQNHLESELNKIRWFCSHCCVTFQNYHEAQFHCRTTHSGFARPVEVIRDHSVRFTWIEAVLRAQKLSMNQVPETERVQNIESENSLLAVLYEEQVPTPEEQMALRTPVASHDSDDEKLVIDENKETRKKMKLCPHCDYNTINNRTLHDHILRHYGLKPFTCTYCHLDISKKALFNHHKENHGSFPLVHKITPIPSETPAEYLDKISSIENKKLICYVCRNLFTENEAREHTHNNEVPSFGRRNDIVVKCSYCSTLFSNTVPFQEHHTIAHPNISANYVLTNLTPNATLCREVIYACGNCNQKFPYIRDIKMHVNTYHSSNPVYTTLKKLHPQETAIQEDILKRKADDSSIMPPSKKIARKSTTKLPFSKLCARKSTTKLPFDVPGESEEFSYYGTRPSSDGLENVTAMMSFCNTIIPFTLKKLNNVININPIVLVTKTTQK